MKLAVLALGLVGVFGLVSCGSDGGSDDDSPPAPKKETEGGTGGTGGDPKKDAAAAQPRLSEGKYFLRAAMAEGFNNQGVKIDPQSVQVTGEYTWTVEALGGEAYQVTATGNAKFSLNNEILFEVNCTGAQDVYTFELTSSNTLRSLRPVELGCPQGLRPVSAQQVSIQIQGKNSFAYIVASQGEGGRSIETYTFSK